MQRDGALKQLWSRRENRGRNAYRAVSQFRAWRDSGYSAPAPDAVKWSVLKRMGCPGGVWVETGTYRGDTTAFLAAEASHVHSIEPSLELVVRAKERFRNTGNVTIHHGLSEDVLPSLLEDLRGPEPISFWLDGHYSAGVTFKGPLDTPIRAELEQVGQLLQSRDDATVLVDDTRCFDPSIEAFSSYPDRSWLVQWADSRELKWTIEHDIFIAMKRESHKA